MAKNQTMIFFFFEFTKGSKKRALHLIKKDQKSHLKRAFMRAPYFRGKKPPRLYALRLSALLTTLLLDST